MSWIILNQSKCLQDGIYYDIDTATTVYDYFIHKYKGDCIFLVEIIDKSNINNHKLIPDELWHMQNKGKR
jgi:hypothetical protein